jgi:DNA-binding beta-propeller fold protein YncE
MKAHCVSLVAGSLVFVTAPPSLGAEAAPAYHVVKSIPIPGDGGWDYVTCDSVARRLYISHSTQTQVMDIDQLKLVGAIPNANGVHGIALAPELGRGFISDGRDNQVTIFNLKSLAPEGTVKTGENPDAVTYDPATQRVFAFNGRSHTAAIFNGTTGELLTMVPLDGKPEFSVADGRGAVYVNLEDQNLLLKINSRAMAVQERWPVAPCIGPSSLAIDTATMRLFAGCGNKKMVVVDATRGKVLADLPIGQHVDSTVFDPQTKLIFNSNGEGTITVIQEDTPDKYRVVQTVPTQQGARTIALDQATHRLFLPDAKLGPPPAPTPQQPKPRPSIIPGTFTILVVSPG